jgi:hypothetical protein
MYVGNHGTIFCDSEPPAARNAGISVIDQNDQVLRLIRTVEDCFSGMVYNSFNFNMYATTGGDDSVVEVGSDVIISTDDNL